ncbi:TPT-domain-containing protein [Lentinula raphanica]|uniref:TPT-domain-containing protein n=1 Tax=Lentinula raphanica TaxID=153919 RepID=A0AA38UK17_9AGAR|nr:TPT-domain-containing protein [Lentinula raphanica]
MSMKYSPNTLLPSPTSHSLPTPSKTSFIDSRPFWLTLYFFFNLGLTLYNKGVLVRFPFPYTLTAIHALFGSLGGAVLARFQVFVPPRLKKNETTILLAFSVLYSVNIVVSNVSLQLVTVPFHQVVRSTTPIFTIMFSALLLGKSSSRWRIITLIPVTVGVGLATYGDYYFTRWGLILTLLGTVLAALKTIFTNVLQSPVPSLTDPAPKSFLSQIYPFSILAQARLHLNSLALLSLLSPLAFVQCVFLAYWTGELDRVRTYSQQDMSGARLLTLALNGCIAFGLNVVSFSANKKVGALGITVAANVKQVLTILCAVMMFHLNITAMNSLGIVLTLLGGAWYARVEYMEKQEQQQLRNRAI